MVARPTLRVQCRRFMSALLPAAELLLGGVLDLRLKHWHRGLQPPPVTMPRQIAVEQVRCMASRVLTEGHVILH